MDDFDRMRLAAHDIAGSEAFENLSPQEINAMDMATYARLTGRLAPAEAVHATRRAAEQQEQAAPAPQLPDSAFTEHVEPQGQTLEELALTDEAAFLQWRQQRGQEYGSGILGSHGSWADAARAKAGRSAMAGNRNTVEAPRLEGRQERQGDRLDTRSARERLSNAANLWQGR